MASDQPYVPVASQESFDGAMESLLACIKTASLAYAIATRRPPEEFIKDLISRL
jgi:hypothetical protein